jgi:hypothetical protein
MRVIWDGPGTQVATHRRVARSRIRGNGIWIAIAVCVVVLAGCGSARSATTSASDPAASGYSTVFSGPASGGASTVAKQPAVAELTAAQDPRATEFPAVAGRSLNQLARLASSTALASPATGTFTPGTRRLAFALTDTAQRFVYAPTAVYLASALTSPASGPFLAPADPIGVARQYRSEQNAGPGGIQAIYWTKVPIPRPGVFDVLTLTRAGGKLIASLGEIAAASSSPIPGVGERPPDVSTDTLASAHGNVSLLTTRLPPEEMHSVSLSQALGKRPVALLFSTPALCTSRVCGPVTDIMVSLQREFAGRITFIHQEVYVDNDPSKGLRPALRAFHLQTEPWLFTINREGIITDRLEGAFGVNEARQALEAALQ